MWEPANEVSEDEDYLRSCPLIPIWRFFVFIRVIKDPLIA